MTELPHQREQFRNISTYAGIRTRSCAWSPSPLPLHLSQAIIQVPKSVLLNREAPPGTSLCMNETENGLNTHLLLLTKTRNGNAGITLQDVPVENQVPCYGTDDHGRRGVSGMTSAESWTSR